MMDSVEIEIICENKSLGVIIYNQLCWKPLTNKVKTMLYYIELKISCI